MADFWVERFAKVLTLFTIWQGAPSREFTAISRKPHLPNRIHLICVKRDVLKPDAQAKDSPPVPSLAHQALLIWAGATNPNHRQEPACLASGSDRVFLRITLGSPIAPLTRQSTLARVPVHLAWLVRPSRSIRN